MVTRTFWGSRSAGSARQRDAWIVFEDSAAGRANSTVPGATADGKDSRWVVSYQRGEITALVRRVRELEHRLQRRSIALAGALALIALGVIGSLGYWGSKSFLPMPEAPMPLAVVTSRGRETTGLPVTVARPQAERAGRVDPNGATAGPRLASLTLEAEQRAVTVKSDQALAGSLPVQAPTHVAVHFPRDDPDAEQLATALTRHLSGRGLTVGEPVPIAVHPSEASIAYYFEEDREGAVAVARMLSGLMGECRLATRWPADPPPRPGSVVVVVPGS